MNIQKPNLDPIMVEWVDLGNGRLLVPNDEPIKLNPRINPDEELIVVQFEPFIDSWGKTREDVILMVYNELRYSWRGWVEYGGPMTQEAVEFAREMKRRFRVIPI